MALVAALAMTMQGESEGLVAREVVEAFVAQEITGPMSLQMQAWSLCELGERELALFVLREAYKDTTSTITRSFLDRGDLDRVFASLGSREIRTEPIRRVILSGSLADLRAAVSFVRECERLGALTGLEQEAQYGKPPPPVRPKIVDLFSILMLYKRTDLALRLVNKEITREEFVSSLDVFGRLAARGADDPMIDAFLKWGTDHFAANQLMVSAVVTSHPKVLDACANALLNRSRAEMWDGGKGQAYNDVISVISILWSAGRRDDALAITKRFEGEIESMVVNNRQSDRNRVVPVMTKLGRDDIVRVAAGRLEKEADELANVSDLERALQGYSEVGTLFAALGDWGEIARVEKKVKQLPDGNRYSFNYLRLPQLARDGRFEEALDIARALPLENYGSLAHSAVRSRLEKGDVEGARELAASIVAYWLERPGPYELGDVPFDLVELGLNDQLSAYLEKLFARRSAYVGRFLLLLGIGREREAAEYIEQFGTEPQEWITSLLRSWKEERYGPLTRLLDVDGRNVFRMGLDNLRDTISERRRGGSASAYIYVLKCVDTEPLLVDEVLHGITRHYSAAPQVGGKYDVRMQILRELMNLDPEDPISVDLQRRVAALVAVNQ